LPKKELRATLNTIVPEAEELDVGAYQLTYALESLAAEAKGLLQTRQRCNTA